MVNNAIETFATFSLWLNRAELKGHAKPLNGTLFLKNSLLFEWNPVLTNMQSKD